MEFLSFLILLKKSEFYEENNREHNQRFYQFFKRRN